MKLFAISGRRHGDDDDSGQHIWANDEESATRAFQSSFFKPDEGYTEDLVYINYTQCIGEMKSGEFVLDQKIDLLRYTGDGFANAFGPITQGGTDGPVNYAEVKDLPASQVWTIIDDDPDHHNVVVRAGWHNNSNVVGYCATSRSWETGNEQYPW